MYKSFSAFSLIAIVIFLLAGAIQSQDENDDLLVAINAMDMDSWKMEEFSLSTDMAITVHAMGRAINDTWCAKAWIINTQTRLPVWEMSFDNSERINDSGWRKFYGDVELPAGGYEAYYGIDRYACPKPKGISGFIDELFKDLDYYENETIVPGIEIESPTEMTDIPQDSSEHTTEVLLQMTGVKDNENRVKGITLNNDMLIHIYMLGEGSMKSGQMYDYAWISNADTRERVWEATMRNSEPAGGVEKNRLVTDNFTLPRGNYLVHYISDDSHSAEQFNQMPPYDPGNWGITLIAENSKQNESVSEFVQKKEEIQPLVSFTRVGNNASLCEGFTLLRDLKIRIKAEGEYSKMTNQFEDYGWIVNAHTREIVWTMTKDNTTHAGGSVKNKLADEMFDLPAGSYLVHYVTDDSHAWDDWNSSPPTQPEKWGIVLLPVDDAFQKTDVQPYSEKNDPAILASFQQVGNKEHRRKSFSLDTKSQLFIYAIGEGDKTEMYDYGWIEDSNKEIVWIMEFNNTTSAGGAKKNRLTRETITLGTGTYTAHYETDNTHSYNNWNADRPDDFMNWGMIIINNDEN